MTSHTPIRIAGAGLAGLTCAIQLARRGISVNVFESRRDSGFHTRCDVIENWTTPADFTAILAHWRIEQPTSLCPADSVEIYDFQGRCYSLTSPRPLFYLVKRGTDRGSLEQSLKRQALDLGVHIRYGEPLAREQADVWAVGSQQRGFFLGVGLTFHTAQPDALKIIIDQRLAPKAYAYCVIIDGQATLAVVLTQRRQFRHARTLLNDAVSAFQRVQPFEMWDVHHSAGWGGVLNAFGQAQRIPISIGEAGGFQDYLWGFGIRRAMLSGVLAARAFAEGLDYERLVAQELRPLVQSSLINRLAYDQANNLFYRA